MKTLFFKEVVLEELNSHGTDFWRSRYWSGCSWCWSRSSWCTNCDMMNVECLTSILIL